MSLSYDEIVEMVDAHVELITVTSQGLSESRERAAKFLVAQAVLTQYLREVDEELSKRSILKDTSYADVLGKSDSGKITEKKLLVIKNDEYKKSLEDYNKWESLRDWVKGFIKIFENAHLFYRGISRENF